MRNIYRYAIENYIYHPVILTIIQMLHILIRTKLLLNRDLISSQRHHSNMLKGGTPTTWVYSDK